MNVITAKLLRKSKRRGGYIPEINITTRSVVCQYHAGLHLYVLLGGGGDFAEPDPYAGGEGLVTCYTQSCAAEMQCVAHACMSFFNGHAMTTHDYCRGVCLW